MGVHSGLGWAVGPAARIAELCGLTRHGGDNLRSLRRIFAIILTTNLVAGLLLLLDITVDLEGELIEILTGFELVGIGIVLLPGFAMLRRESAKTLLFADELASLSEAKQAAENASRAKSRYLATVSHEIRSPLNAIYGYAQLAERDDGISHQEAARVIRRSAEHLASLVEGLLDISQLEFGMLRARSEVVRFSEFIEQVVWMMRPSAASKGIEFNFVAAERMPEYVRLDQSRFRQALINLLSNAIKFTDSGSVTLAVRYSGQIATFEIRDTGSGIAPQDRERIFEPFERVGGDGVEDEPSPRNRPGAGLGLAITRAIVQILGGKLELESEVGVGTCFRITMMLSEVAGQVMPQDVPRRIVGYDGRRRTILLIEDDAGQRAFVEQLLHSIGLDVVAAPSGEKALKIASARHFDMAIVDISLPGMSGWEAAAKLRERLGEECRVMMLSANSDESYRPDFAAPVHDRFLIKPVKFESLIDAIGSLLKLGWRWDVSGRYPPEAPIEGARSDQGRQALGEVARAHVIRLQEFLRIGYIRGIEAEIRHLSEAAPKAAPFIDSLNDCLDRYDLAGMAKLLQES